MMKSKPPDSYRISTPWNPQKHVGRNCIEDLKKTATKTGKILVGVRLTADQRKKRLASFFRPPGPGLKPPRRTGPGPAQRVCQFITVFMCVRALPKRFQYNEEKWGVCDPAKTSQIFVIF